ncbi:MAG: transposase [Chloroflexota bacterium]
MQLNSWGHIAHDMWTETAVHFHAVSIDTFVVMPNHTHAIITISSPDAVGAGFPRPSGPPPAESATPNSAGPSLGQIIGFYKWMTTKRINEIRGTPGRSLWQRNYFEHVIRGQRSYEAIGEYIVTNPARWREDSLNSDA